MIQQIISQLNSDYGLSLKASDYSGYLFKKITNSTTIAVNKSGHQYHIDVTTPDGPMKMFPVVIGSENLDSYSPDSKRDFYVRLSVVVYNDNITDLVSDVQKRATSQSKTLRVPAATLIADQTAVFGTTKSVDSFSYSVYSKRTTGQHQTEIGRSDDDKAFRLLRALLIPDDYILFLKYKNEVKYSVFGFSESTFNTKYQPIVGGNLFHLAKDETSVTSSLIMPGTAFKVNGKNVIFFGPPGTGKSTLVDSVIQTDDNFRITFHPDTDYNSFVGAYKPIVNEDGNIGYDFVPQAFIKAYLHAWTHPDKAVYLVIEEINRGNCAQVFGDIFQLLDRDSDGYSTYAVTIDSELEKYIQAYFDGSGRATEKQFYLDVLQKKYNSNGFSKLALPNNLYILATMNTSDQSLFPMDSAFKRRWDWEYVRIDYEKAKDIKININDAHSYSWGTFLEKINGEVLENTQSEDKQIGNWFVKPVDGVISFDTFRSKVMFYLWNELCKDEYQTNRNLFKIKTEDDTTVDFTYNDLFSGYRQEKVEPEDLIIKFMEYHDIPKIP